MKRLKLFFACLLMAVLSIGQVWADQVSFGPSDFSGKGTPNTGSAMSATKDGITISISKGYGTTEIRAYSGSAFTISSSNTITALSFTFSGGKNGGLSTSYTDLSTTEWSQSSLSSQARFSDITVTYTPSSTEPAGSMTPDPTSVEVAAAGEENGSIAISFDGITDKDSQVEDVALYNDAAHTSEFTGSWIIADWNSEKTAVEYVVEANTGAARTAYIYLYALDDNDNDVETVIEVSQAEYVEPFDGLKLTFDFVNHPTDWPAAKADAAAGDYIYTLSAVDYTFTHSKVGDGIYMTGTSGSSGALLMVSGNTLGLPALSGYKLVKVEGTLNSAGTPSTSSQVAITDGSDVVNGGAAQTWDTKGVAKTYNLSGTAENTRYYMSISNKNCQMMTLVLYYEEAEAAVVAQPSVTGEDNFYASTEVSMSCTTAGADIYYTTTESAKATPATSDDWSAYDNDNKPSFDVTTTVWAAATDGAHWSEITEKTFTKATVMTVAQALEEAQGTGKYVKGIIRAIDEVSTEHGNATYYLKDEGQDNSIKIYRGKYLNDANFTVADQIIVGDEVTVFGELKVFSEVNQFTQGNYIKALKPAARLSWNAASYDAEIGGSNTFPTLTNTNSVTVTYSSSDETVATISSDGTSYALKKAGTTTITAAFAGNETYKANSASYTLNVANSVIRADISFEENGGTPEVTDLTQQSNLPDPLPTITKAGFNFGGWWTTETFEDGTEAVAGAAVESTDAITLYAKWNDPYTVAEALAIINAMDVNAETDSKVYVSGIITPTERSYYSSYHSITYMISDDGTATAELKVYSGKGVNDADFSAVTDLQDADEVVVYGKLKRYQKNSTSPIEQEVNQPNYIYSLIRPAVPSISADPAAVENVAVEGVTDQTIALTYENIENYETEVSLHPNADGTGIFTGGWLTASVSDADDYATVTYSVSANDGAARIAYIKVYTTDGDKEATTIIPVSQVKYEAPASLPFTFAEGRADIEDKQGMSQEGLGSDYTGDVTTKLKFDGTGDWVIINIASAPAKLTYDIKGNGFSGGTFTVQESADGSVYSDVATYTELGDTQNEEKTLAQATRYVKFIYTEKSSGNVGLGNITIAAPVAVETPTFSLPEGAYTGTQSVALSCTTEGATIYYTTNGDDPDDSSAEYTDAISVDETMTIKAIAYKGEDHSEIASATYTIIPALTDYYEKVTSGAVAEGTYLIVYEDASVAFDGGLETLDAVENSIAVNIVSGNKIGVTTATEAATFYIDPTAGTIQAASGMYIGQGSDANGLGTSESASTYTNSFSFDEGNAVIVSSSAHLCYNSASNQLRFRYYKSSSYSSQQPIALYKLANEVIKPASGLAWNPADDITLTVGDAFTAPTLLNPENIDPAEITIVSSNTDVATVSEGVVSLVENGIGTTTISATYTGEAYKPITVSYKIKVNPAYSIYVDNLNVNFGSVEKDAEVADKMITVTLTNVAAATATLAGDGASAFSIDPVALTESGNITISASSATEGTYAATITISDDAHNAESKVVNLSLTVTEPAGEETSVATDSKWVAATDADLVDGAEVLITGVASDVTYAIGVQNDNNRAAVAGTLSEGVFTPGENTMSFTLVDQGDGTFALQASNGEYLYAASSTKNWLRRQATVDDNAKWTITAASAEANGSNTHKVLKFNASNSPKIFSCYTGEQTDIQFYVPKPAPAPDTYHRDVTSGNYGTICLPKAGTIEGAMLYNIGSYENGMIYVDEAGTTLEAGKPYIFYATSTSLDVTYTDATEVAAGKANGLYGSYTQESLTPNDGNYILYNNQYWLVTSEAYVGANRAYIKIDKINYVAPMPGRRRIGMTVHGEQVVTGIDALNASETPVKMIINGQLFILRGEKMYNANGQIVK